MDEAVARSLVDINRAFYQSFAGPFARTRERVQPGVDSLLARIAPDARILDLGCGSAAVLDSLSRRGFCGDYLGVDISAPLLGIARTRKTAFPTAFLEADLHAGDWPSLLPDRPVDVVFLFAVLHHIPEEERRAELLRLAANQMKTDGALMFSAWQFQRSRRLAARVVPWAEADLQDAQLAPGDYLLDWRREGRGLRYVHVIPDEEAARLARRAGCREREKFASDGEGGRLSDYRVWVRDSQPPD